MSNSMSFLYDITTQAAGTRSFNSSSFKGDGDQPISTMPIYDYDDESFCSSGTLSTSTSLTSLSSSISDDEILTRPSSSQGWSFDGAWSIGEPVYTPKFQSQSSLSIHIDDHDKDLTERGLIESQFLVAQYVAYQLRATLGKEDPAPWTPEMQTPTMTPEISGPTGPAMRRYEDLVQAMNLQTPDISAMNAPNSLQNALSSSLPTIMITAPSSEQVTPTIGNANLQETSNFLTLCYSLRTREECSTMQPGWGQTVTSDSDESSYSGDDDDVVLSQVKRSLQEARRPKPGLTGRVVNLLRMRR